MSRHPRLSLRLAALLAGVAVAATPLSAQTTRTISPSERAEGAKAHPQLVAEFGGAMSGAQASYVTGIGQNIAIQSGLGNARNDFTVTLLNSSVNNAFAIPGGYVYTTRQLVALMNNEAELAAVLGHEIAHVAARHSAKRQKTATRNTILGVLGQVLGSVVGGGFGNLLAQGAQYVPQVLTLQYSRGQETQADNLGIQYLRGAGYDPRAMGTVLASLANQNALEARLMGRGQTRVPEWASTHPDPASRVRAALNRAGANPTGVTNRDTFLNRIDGVMYGDDPRQGVVEDGTFVHPDYRFTFRAPNGFYLVNGTRSVTIGGQSGKGELTTASFNGNLETYVRSIFAALGRANQVQLAPSSLQRTTVNGLPAAYGLARVNSGNGQVDVTVFAYEFSNNQAFHFMTITQAGQAAVFNPMFGSMRRISASEASAVRPRRVDVVTVGASDTVNSLARRMAYSNMQLERFLVLNGLSANSRLTAGQRVKIVTY
ncbi:MAG: M48 family metalloprotease [Novosphingobium sp.]|nr:M48 family metalloprotease [Novosphingobium sp.]